MVGQRNALKFGSIAHYLERVYHIRRLLITNIFMGFPGGSDGKESTCNAEDLGLIPGSGISPGEGNGNPLLYSWLENPMDRGAWWATVFEVAKSRIGLSN